MDDYEDICQEEVGIDDMKVQSEDGSGHQYQRKRDSDEINFGITRSRFAALARITEFLRAMAEVEIIRRRSNEGIS